MLRLSEAQAAQLTGQAAKTPVRGTRKQQRLAVAAPVACVQAITLELPWLPGTNNLFATVNGRRVKTETARAYCAAAGRIARCSIPTPYGGRLAVEIRLRPKRGLGVDVDNVKAAIDALTGVAWGDDRQIWRLTTERFAPVAGGAVEITIAPYAPADVTLERRETT